MKRFYRRLQTTCIRLTGHSESHPSADARGEELPEQGSLVLGKSLGFTLIEMLVVVSLVVLIFLMALPSISSSFKISVNSAARNISSVVTEAYNAAVITGRVYRIAVDIKKGSYLVESGSPRVLLDTKETKEKEEARKRFLKPNEIKTESPFSLDTTITRKKQSLPVGVVFEDVMSEISADPIIEGIAYSHFFPHGLTEQTIIHIKDNSDHHASLVITSVIGQTDLYDRYVDKKEAFPK